MASKKVFSNVFWPAFSNNKKTYFYLDLKITFLIKHYVFNFKTFHSNPFPKFWPHIASIKSPKALWSVDLSSMSVFSSSWFGIAAQSKNKKDFDGKLQNKTLPKDYASTYILKLACNGVFQGKRYIQLYSRQSMQLISWTQQSTNYITETNSFNIVWR